MVNTTGTGSVDDSCLLAIIDMQTCTYSLLAFNNNIQICFTWMAIGVCLNFKGTCGELLIFISSQLIAMRLWLPMPSNIHLPHIIYNYKLLKGSNSGVSWPL